MSDDAITRNIMEGVTRDIPALSQILTNLCDAFCDYVCFPDQHAATAVTLWTAATHVQRYAYHAPRLAIIAPEKRCGKSKLLDVIYEAAHKPILTANTSVNVLFRSIDEKSPPTIMVDETDSMFGTRKAAENHEDLRGLINAGHQRGRPALRCVGNQHEPKMFPTFAMVALAGIGELPETIMDRSIRIRMRRRHRGERLWPFRARRDGPRLNQIRNELSLFLDTHFCEEHATPSMGTLEDREADTWEPLFAIAALAGDPWPHLVREAAAVMTESDEEVTSDSTALLIDIREAFRLKQGDEITTEQLLITLKIDPEKQWRTYGRRGEGIDARTLADMLRGFGIKPRDIRQPNGRVLKGYRRENFEDTWTRYVPSPHDEGTVS